jgi:hypothetical protein
MESQYEEQLCQEIMNTSGLAGPVAVPYPQEFSQWVEVDYTRNCATTSFSPEASRNKCRL